ncbi:Thiol:disulfide interchange protein DsbA [Candidatus Erwinia haradaeae]|uniref:Thiol:disulfide interchange protein n=1 Tax=Candidatus Erwinia haradaeae TaxID=1922217 RepID=A0A451DCM1_9GAMM|nr:DsbA family protein [Candidatus Erwinia haradaeae]VFP84147.1 Thiol:disulfide interchange protein DsbA [Candidatus Erwinia haradaeae]
MKNIFFTVVAMVLAYSAFAAPFNDGKQYMTLTKPITTIPPVLEFFSFYCPHCYEFEKAWYNQDILNGDFGLHGQVVKYHIINFGGDMGQTLSHVWAMARMMGVEKKVMFPIFEGLLINKTIVDSASLKKVFIKSTGIKSEDYDSAWHNPIVLSLLEKQKKISEDINLPGVPVMLINGKYIVTGDGLDRSSINTYIHQYANTVRYLLSKR